MDNNDKYLGRILDNRYEILELIGAGGMAYVYKALCHRLNRLVAIKILKEDLANDEEFQRRFYTESQAVAMLSHPNIVAVYDVSRSGNTEYIVMELIEGITLKQYINRKGLLNWKEVLHFSTQIIKAIAHAHSRGIIHRDIKPHNIMILKDGSVKVADFGIARLLSVQNTLTQEALGSVHYISPEQAKGGQIDARSDIYSVGVVMYEMLTSRLPFVGESAVSVAIQHISAIPLSPRDINPDIPIGLEEITMHAMEPDVNMRFTTADEMLDDLEDFRKNPSIIFNYSISSPAERRAQNYGTPYETRVIPREPVDRPPPPVVPVRTKPDMTGSEYRNVKRRSSSTATLVGIFAVVAFILVLFIVFILPSMLEWIRPESDEQITIPDVVGEPFDIVRISDEYFENFRFEIAETIPSEDIPEGRIISQRPTAGTTQSMPIGSNRIIIRVVLSSGPLPPEEMPNLIGASWTEARRVLNALRLDLDIREEAVEDDRTFNEVIETDPRAGSLLTRGDIIIIRYSLGPARTVEVPTNLRGGTEASVMDRLRELGLNPHVARREESLTDPPEPAGTVTFVSFEGQRVQTGTQIDIFVSTGPPPPPPPTEPPPTEPPPTDTPPPPPDTGDGGETDTGGGGGDG
ncbi:MAG: Stk1 family PASTA domain-containing Ser/Thr kinase [Oscillospiraceae bacterium]|nr:Stk1 family PASTA domain-containing Ser/Thr kinase [Oscillospiraceae bacterium]